MVIKKSFTINNIYKKIVKNMKTTIEINGYEIVIEEIDGLISVSAVKDEEVIEEFEIQSGAQSQVEDEESESGEEFDGGEEVQDFEEFGSEDSEENEDSEEDQDSDDDDDDENEEENEEKNESKLESFQSFLKKRK
jgi:hypothetical protein